MKKILSCFVILGITAISSFGQIPYWSWVTGESGPDSEICKGITTDANNNVIIIGQYQPTAVFDSISFPGGPGSDNIFVVKYDPSGNIQWAKSAGSNYISFASDVATDSDGNIYISGSFSGDSMVFDNIVLYSTVYPQLSVYIAKYDPLGNVIWVRGAGIYDKCESSSITVDNPGHVYIAGNFSSPTVTFGGVTLNNACGQRVLADLPVLNGLKTLRLIRMIISWLPENLTVTVWILETQPYLPEPVGPVIRPLLSIMILPGMKTGQKVYMVVVLFQKELQLIR
jgi:hypothetical protein